MNSQMVDIPTADGVADAYLTRPDDGLPHPGVLMLTDAFGLRPQVEKMADRIAAEGFVVLAPNIFYRSRRAPVLDMSGLDTTDRQALMAQLAPLMEALTPGRIVSDGAVWLEQLQLQAPGPVAITGYCMGVRTGWRIAAAYPETVAALGGFHGGGLATDEPDSPHRLAAALSAELYLGHADNDASMTPENVAEIERALDEAGVTYRSELYEGAMHGYTMADMPVYDERAAERHFEALFALLGRTVAA